ncbi:MAG: DUF3050 domain-containing protein [Galbibacter orientalis]|uniref:DUF3050 domain-containing protein n=1 Tax=Galbibacter orientalis TaxID=453852 RepID=UPI003003275A
MNIEKINEHIGSQREVLLAHPLYKAIQTPIHLQTFLEHHVYAVWDFMSLLKALQNSLTCTSLPWKPVGNPVTRYLINEIVLGEETDVDENGAYKSHYEMYLEAMQLCGASISTIEDFVNSLSTVKDVQSVLDKNTLPSGIQEFLKFTFEVIAEGKPHKIAAAFTFGREDLIPDMFTAILKDMQQEYPEIDMTRLVYYFERHIEVDGDTHGPLAYKMVEELCGNDQNKWQEVEEVALVSLEKRTQLWDGILRDIKAQTIPVNS